MSYKILHILNCRAIARLAREPLFKNSFFMAITSIFNAASGFFFWMIAAKLYTVEEVGLATALISSIGLVVLFSRLGFDFSIIRFFPENDKAKVFGTSFTITTIASILVGATFIFLVERISPPLIFLKNPGYALAFLLIVIVDSVAAITGRGFYANRNAKYYFFQNVLMALRICLLIPLAFLGSFGILGSYGLSFLIASLFALIVFQGNVEAIRPNVDMEFLKKSFKFSSWNYASNILATAPTLILPLMVLNMLGEAEAAKYYIAFAIGNLVLIIPRSLSTSLFVEGSYGEDLKKSTMRACGASLAFLVPAAIVMFFLGDWLLGLLGREYVDSFDLLRILVLSSFLVTIYSFFIPIQNVRMRVGSIVKVNLARCVLFLGLSYIFIGRYGILGVGYGWLITYMLIVVAIGWTIKREGWF